MKRIGAAMEMCGSLRPLAGSSRWDWWAQPTLLEAARPNTWQERVLLEQPGDLLSQSF